MNEGRNKRRREEKGVIMCDVKERKGGRKGRERDETVIIRR